MSSMHEHPEQWDWERSGSIDHCNACHLEDLKQNVARVPLELHDCDKRDCPLCGGLGNVGMSHVAMGLFSGGSPCVLCHSTGRVREQIVSRWVKICPFVVDAPENSPNGSYAPRWKRCDKVFLHSGQPCQVGTGEWASAARMAGFSEDVIKAVLGSRGP